MKIYEILDTRRKFDDPFDQEAYDNFFTSDGALKLHAQKLGQSKWKDVAMTARRLDPQHRDIEGAIKQSIDIHYKKSEQDTDKKPKAKTKSPITPPIDKERSRKDTLGRNLRHDKYYRDKKDRGTTVSKTAPVSTDKVSTIDKVVAPLKQKQQKAKSRVQNIRNWKK